MYVGTFSYAISGASYLILTLLLLTSWRGRLLGGLLLAGVAYLSLWSFLFAFDSHYNVFSPYWVFVIELFRYALWLILLIHFLESGRERKFTSSARWLIYSTIFLILMSGMVLCYFEDRLFMDRTGNVITLTSLVMAIASLVLIEQIYRNILPQQRWAIKFFCIGLGAMFVFDIYLYSDALIMSSINESIWNMRGFAFTLVMPLLAITAARNPQWSLQVFVSRQIVFYTTGVIATGVYLLFMSVGAYYIKINDQSWDMVAQFVFLFAAAILWFVVLSSGKIRGKIKVFLTTHFYKNKYDYRELWLSFVDTLSYFESDKRFKDNVLIKVASIIDASSGIFFSKDKNVYVYESSYNFSSEKIPGYVKKEIAEQDVGVIFDATKTLVDLSVYSSDTEPHKNKKLPEWLAGVNDAWFILPLVHHEEIIGFMLFTKSKISTELSWEDEEMLNAVALQVASYLTFIQTSKALSEAERFETFNRLSAFVVHDIKNQVAQLELIIQNSVKHKNNQDFINDSFKTVENVASRMQRMLAQLKKARFTPTDSESINLLEIVNEVIRLRSTEEPKITLETTNEELVIKAEKDRLVSVLEHLTQNAQQATKSEGKVIIRVYQQENNAIIEIEDNGEGMTDEFIRERLFKAFDTTKGNAGMGIGVFESREYVKHYGGRITVQSIVNEGTKFTIQLPLGTDFG